MGIWLEPYRRHLKSWKIQNLGFKVVAKKRNNTQIKEINTFKLFKRPFPGVLTILTL